MQFNDGRKKMIIESIYELQKASAKLCSSFYPSGENNPLVQKAKELRDICDSLILESQNNLLDNLSLLGKNFEDVHHEHKNSHNKESV